MKKKWIYIIICVLLIIGLAIATYFVFKPQNTKEGEKNKKNSFSYMPLLYKICDEDSCIHLLGSVHVGNSKITKFDDKLLNIFDKSDALAVEINTSEVALNQFDFVMTDKTLNDILDIQTINKLKDFQEKYPMFNYDLFVNFKPGFLYTYLESVVLMDLGYASTGVDEFLIKRANNSNKNIISIETYEDQLNLLINYSDALYIKLINSFLDEYEDAEEIFEKLYDAYLNADKDKLIELLDAEEGEIETEEEKAYLKAMYDDRNLLMADCIKGFLKDNKNVFVTVGEAHVVGKRGIIDLLTNDYKVEIVK